MFKNSITLARRHGARVAAAGTAALVGSSAFAQGTTLGDILDAVDLSAIAAPVGAAALIIVTVALLFKGPALAKRIISKV